MTAQEQQHAEFMTARTETMTVQNGNTPKP